jgi:hypothetical protein
MRFLYACHAGITEVMKLEDLLQHFSIHIICNENCLHGLKIISFMEVDYTILNGVKSKKKLSRYTPWRHMRGEEV